MAWELLQGDCLEVMKGLPGESIDLIVTDPPYKVTARGNYGNTGGMLQKKLAMQGKIFKHNDIKPIEYIPEFYRLLKNGTHCYIMTNHVNLQEMLNVGTECGFKFIKSLIWNKGNKIMGRYYMNQFEYILFFRKGEGKMINNCGTADILNIPNNKTKVNGQNIHDTEKPVALMGILIENSSNLNDTVLDPFAGSGTTGVAAEQCRRNSILIEIDPDNWGIIRRRMDSIHPNLFERATI